MEKRAYLLTLIGGKAYDTLENLCSPKLPKEYKYEALIEKLVEYFSPKLSIIVERFMFFGRIQKETESVSEYLVEIKRLASTCGFGEFLKESLRDKLVCGLRNAKIQRRILSEGDVPLARVIEIAFSMEAAEKNTKIFHFNEPADNVDKIRAEVGDRYDREQKRKCKHCGRSREEHTSGRQVSRFLNQRKIHRIEDQEEEEEEESVQRMVFMRTYDYRVKYATNEPPYVIKVRVEDILMTFEIDTGSCLTLISEKDFKRYIPDVQVKDAGIIVKTYDGTVVPILGGIDVKVDFRGTIARLRAVVVRGERKALLGREWINVLKIGNFVDQMPLEDTLAQLLRGHQAVFGDTTDPIKGFTFAVNIQDVNPIFHKARPVPFAIRMAVNEVLERMVEKGYLYQVPSSKWATPVVVVPKKNKKFRICCDFKVTLNRFLDTAAYPLPTQQDLFSVLARGKGFLGLKECLLDWQMPLVFFQSDNGPQFTGVEMKSFFERNGVKQTLIPAYHPQRNGLAERAVQLIKMALEKNKRKFEDTIQDTLSRILLTYRCTPHETTGKTPSELFMGRSLRTRLTLIHQSLENRVRERQARQMRYDRGKGQEEFEVNDQMWCKNFRGVGWIPGRIVGIKGSRVYTGLINGQVKTYHRDQIRRRWSSGESEDEAKKERKEEEDPIWMAPESMNSRRDRESFSSETAGQPQDPMSGDLGVEIESNPWESACPSDREAGMEERPLPRRNPPRDRRPPNTSKPQAPAPRYYQNKPQRPYPPNPEPKPIYPRKTYNKSPNSNKNRTEDGRPMCFKCNKPGHVLLYADKMNAKIDCEREIIKYDLTGNRDIIKYQQKISNLAKHRIDSEGAKPIKHKPYRVSAKERDNHKKEINEIVRDGIIRPSSSPWSFAVILVTKRDANYPFKRIGIDFVGPLPLTKRRRKWIIVLTEYHTDNAETKALSEATVKEVSTFLIEHIILRHGAPRFLISDRGSQFTSNLMKEAMKICRVKLCFTTSYHSQTNRLTERQNRTLINMISMYVNTDQNNRNKFLPFISHAYNTTILETTGYFPFLLLFGREPMPLLDDENIPMDSNMNDYDEYIENHLVKIARTRQVIVNNIEKTQERMKRNNGKNNNEKIYEPRHLVAVWIPVRKIGKCKQLLRKYFGPYRILKKLSNVNN
ncbi:K02A2.6-like [Cordylochernes scorpioides]|uniref:K02A2.6-like n=1 Tax=Cordylochernes scorpioides TaxID=51811 RepID=A0ABY6KTY7_9ARAC|nr:K02A2.6-like [Cordylochernes scorpioides]